MSRSRRGNLKEVIASHRLAFTMGEFYDIVCAATDEQRHVLGELIGSGFGSQPNTLCDHVKYLWAGTLGYLWAGTLG